MAKKKRPKGWWVKERIARAEAAKAQTAALARQQRVHGGGSPPPESPSESVRAILSGFESNRRRH